MQVRLSVARYLTTGVEYHPMQVSAVKRPSPPQPQPLGLRPGELVRVRSAIEISPTLDPDGTLDGLPFMPEMLKYCGRTLPVSMRADKTCAGDGVVRRMHNTVHLAGVRCDGGAHGGCQAACLMFWKEAWLERVEDGSGAGAGARTAADEPLRETLIAATTVPSDGRPAVPLPGDRDPAGVEALAIQ